MVFFSQSAPLNENKREHLVPRLSLPDTDIVIQSIISNITAVHNCWLRRHAKSKAQNCASTPYKCFFADVCVIVKWHSSSEEHHSLVSHLYKLKVLLFVALRVILGVKRKRRGFIFHGAIWVFSYQLRIVESQMWKYMSAPESSAWISQQCQNVYSLIYESLLTDAPQ